MDRPSPVDTLRQEMRLALLLNHVALAGCVDAMGWLLLGGLFVSFMSGNSTQLAVALASGQWEWAGRVAVLLGAFFAGVFLGAVVYGRSRNGSHAGVFVAATMALGLALALVLLGGLSTLNMAPLAFAMGMMNNARRVVSGVPIGGTFVTGAFVAMSQGLAQWLMGKAGPQAFAPWAMSWCALVLGATLGAALVVQIGQGAALALPVVWSAALTIVHLALSRRG